MDKRKYFLEVFSQASKHYEGSSKRLAAEGWREDWQILIATILSAQTRDETTIPVCEDLFKRYDTVRGLSQARLSEVQSIIRRVNFYKNKSKHIVGAAQWLIKHDAGHKDVRKVGHVAGHKARQKVIYVPDTIEELIKIPGVGRKTANLVIAQVHSKDGICVDTHVHRISNVFGFVDTKTPTQTEIELMKIVPRKYWSKINRVFVLWGKDVRGRDKQKFLEKIRE